MLHFARAAHTIAVMLGEIEVVAADTIDGARCITRERAHSDHGTAATEVAQQERDAEPGGEL